MKREYREQMVKCGQEREMLRKEIEQIGQRIEELERITSRKGIEKDKERGENGRLENKIIKVERMLEKNKKKEKKEI